MDLRAYFTNIHNVIIDHLSNAQQEIIVAVAWFTDQEIYDVLCKKAQLGIKVSIALIADDINQRPGGLNFNRIKNLGATITFIPATNSYEGTMHHKFCVIDQSTVITGSYNWSKKARENDENITIVTDAQDFARRYLDTYDELLTRAGAKAPIINSEAAKRRLEMIRNLILLEEQDELTPHLNKLRPIATSLNLETIVRVLDDGQYREALEQIDSFLKRFSAVIPVQESEIARLRFILEVLELRLESLSDEKAELERKLLVFNRRHDEILGDLIKRVLQAKSELAHLHAQEKLKQAEDDSSIHQQAQEAQDEAKRTQKTYDDYTRHHEKLKDLAPLPELDEISEKELRALYRKACSLCHPDKVSEEKKEQAHFIFIELKTAYKNNDIPRVKEIYDSLASGNLMRKRSTVLSEVDKLKAAIAELQFTIAKLIQEHQELSQSQGVQLMNLAGESEHDWHKFLHQQSKALEAELVDLVAELLM